ncbi:13013_t:CDS:2, partial [Gigaspora margarita]
SSGGIKRSNNSKHDSVPLDEEWEMLENGELFRDSLIYESVTLIETLFHSFGNLCITMFKDL